MMPNNDLECSRRAGSLGYKIYLVFLVVYCDARMLQLTGYCHVGAKNHQKFPNPLPPKFKSDFLVSGKCRYLRDYLELEKLKNIYAHLLVEIRSFPGSFDPTESIWDTKSHPAFLSILKNQNFNFVKFYDFSKWIETLDDF